MDLQGLASQFTGRKFGELVLHQFKRTGKDRIAPALAGTIQQLPPAAMPLAEPWIDEITSFGTDPAFWQSDAGQTFSTICNAAKQRLSEAGITPSDDDLFTMFQIILLNFVYGLHKHP